jgi:hypothetical protein
LRKYLEDVGRLLIEKSLHHASHGDNLSTVVRAQTLAVLEGLDPARKRILLLFLNESGLSACADRRIANMSSEEMDSESLRRMFVPFLCYPLYS